MCINISNFKNKPIWFQNLWVISFFYAFSEQKNGQDGRERRQVGHGGCGRVPQHRAALHASGRGGGGAADRAVRQSVAGQGLVGPGAGRRSLNNKLNLWESSWTTAHSRTGVFFIPSGSKYLESYPPGEFSKRFWNHPRHHSRTLGFEKLMI